MSVKKRICFVAQFPPPVHGLSKAVATLWNSPLSRQYDLEKVDISRNLTFPLTVARLLLSNADLFYLTISQTQFGNLRDLAILALIHLRKRPCLIHLHGAHYRELLDSEVDRWQRRANQEALSRVAGVIVLSRSMRVLFQGLVDESRIHVLSNCVDDDYLLSDDEFEEKLRGITARAPARILYLSNFIKSKGYLDVLDLARRERDRIFGGGRQCIHVDFAGRFSSSNEEAEFITAIDRDGLGDLVTYHGAVSGTTKRQLLNDCGYLVLLSRYANEGQPISIIEGLSAGMVVLSTWHAGIPDLVEDGVNGLLFDPASLDTGSIYESVIGITPQMRLMMGRSNRLKALQYFRQTQYVDGFGGIVQACLSQDSAWVEQ